MTREDIFEEAEELGWKPNNIRLLSGHKGNYMFIVHNPWGLGETISFSDMNKIDWSTTGPQKEAKIYDVKLDESTETFSEIVKRLGI